MPPRPLLPSILLSLLLAPATADDPAAAYRTGYHPQPLKNWINDPNGPVYFNGTYHLFMQYNPDSWQWGPMHWGHLKSKDLLHWEDLPPALGPEYDWECGGIFSGSATIFEGRPVLTYSVMCCEVEAQAYPMDVSDPDLVSWKKLGPLIRSPDGCDGMRDPTTAWKGEDGIWRQVSGCIWGPTMWKSKDFTNWTEAGPLFPTQFGFQECPDFFQLPGTDLHVLKASLLIQDATIQKQDWWTVGNYTEVSDINKPDLFVNVSTDVGAGMNRLDMGLMYASKTFYDPPNDRRVLIGWITIHCNNTDWSGVETFPRVILPDPMRENSIITVPIPEIESLYDPATPIFHSDEKVIEEGNHILITKTGSQLDIFANFSIVNDGAAEFGLRVFVDPDEPTTVYQEISMKRNSNGEMTLFGEPFQMYEDDNGVISIRALVDRSVVECFVQGGRQSYSQAYCAPNPDYIDKMGVQVFVNKNDVKILSVDIFNVETANQKPDMRIEQ